jgi:hypothetical protein
MTGHGPEQPSQATPYRLAVEGVVIAKKVGDLMASAVGRLDRRPKSPRLFEPPFENLP